MRETVPSPAFVTQRSRSPTASASGALPTGIEVAWPSTTRSTASSPDAATQTAPRVTTGLSGWRPAGTAPGAAVGARIDTQERAAAALATHTFEPATVMPSGRVRADRRGRGRRRPTVAVADGRPPRPAPSRR